jgi:hypothetical protein
MKNLLCTFLSALAIAAVAYTASAQTQFTGHGFNEAGAFRLTVSGAAELESSQDLSSWSKYASTTQPTTLDDLASRQMERRFYRIQGGANVIGFLKATIAPAKMAILGNSFGTALRLDTPEGRQAVFGTTNPAVKVSLYTNANFVAHTFDASSGSWQPQLRAIRPQEGFAVHNNGNAPINVRMSGVVRQGNISVTVPAAGALFASPFPTTSPTAQLASVVAQDGTQVLSFDEQTQNYKTSTFDTLEKPGKWEPKLPEVRPGRAVIIKSPQPLTWTNNPAAMVR